MWTDKWIFALLLLRFPLIFCFFFDLIFLRKKEISICNPNPNGVDSHERFYFSLPFINVMRKKNRRKTTVDGRFTITNIVDAWPGINDSFTVSCPGDETLNRSTANRSCKCMRACECVRVCVCAWCQRATVVSGWIFVNDPPKWIVSWSKSDPNDVSIDDEIAGASSTFERIHSGLGLVCTGCVCVCAAMTCSLIEHVINAWSNVRVVENINELL